MSHTRRNFLRWAGAGVVLTRFRPARSATTDTSKRVLVVVMQRGAVDGLSMVPPYAEPRYFEVRPTIAIPAPDKPDGALRLDDRFALHPALAPLLPRWKQSELALVHSVGSPDPTRSHFDAQDFFELGTPGVKSTDSGWMSRAIPAVPAGTKPSDLRAIALAPTLPRIFMDGPKAERVNGGANALAINSLDDFTVQAPGMPADAKTFEELYAGAVDKVLRGTANEAFDAIATLRKLPAEVRAPQHGAKYPTSALGKHLQQIGLLVRADVGLEFAMTDCGGWDTHVNQGSSKGQLAGTLDDLAQSLAAFATDIGDALPRVCVVTATEFGRTVRENGTKGTDHGHGSVMMVLGGKVRGGHVYGKWQGLADTGLYQARDVAVTTDHRQVTGAIIAKHIGEHDISRIFPGFDFAKSPPLPIF
jgi:uncharacterized protein (DUF1501 family)